MDIQKTILDEAVHIYFQGGDWKAYIMAAVREQRRKEIGTKELRDMRS